MVKKKLKKIDDKAKQITSHIEKKIKTPSQAVKDCNARLLTEPDNVKVQGWRRDALYQLDEGIKGLPYPLSQFDALIDELVGELTEKPDKNTPERANYVNQARNLSRVWRDLYNRKKTVCDDAEADGLIERVMF